MTISKTSSPLAHLNERPAWCLIDTIVVHTMSAPCEQDPHSAEQCIATLETAQVSSHYLLGRDGDCWSLVPEEKRAWHAGESCLRVDGKTISGVNDFSIGIELVCEETQKVSEEQYDSLGQLVAEIIARHPIRHLVGHDDIAMPPGRKTDPGTTFDWNYFKEKLEELGLQMERLRFPS